MNVWNIIRTDLIFCGFPLYYIYYFKSEKQGIYTHTSCYSLFFFFFFNSFFRRRIIRFLILVYEEKKNNNSGVVVEMGGCMHLPDVVIIQQRESHTVTHIAEQRPFFFILRCLYLCVQAIRLVRGGGQWRGEGSNSPTSIIPYSLRSLSVRTFQNEGELLFCWFCFFSSVHMSTPPLRSKPQRFIYMCRRETMATTLTRI